MYKYCLYIIKEVIIKVGKEVEGLKNDLKDGYNKLDQKA